MGQSPMRIDKILVDASLLANLIVSEETERKKEEENKKVVGGNSLSQPCWCGVPTPQKKLVINVWALR